MRKILIISLLAISSLVQAQQKAYITSVYDGDTYYAKVKNQVIRIRLSGVDCPEVANKYTAKVAQDFAEAARDSVKKLILHKTVIIKNIGTDRYLRSVCQVWVGGKDLSNMILKRGYGWAFFEYQNDKTRLPMLVKYQNAAAKKQVGLWAFPNPIEPHIYRKK